MGLLTADSARRCSPEAEGAAAGQGGVGGGAEEGGVQQPQHQQAVGGDGLGRKSFSSTSCWASDELGNGPRGYSSQQPQHPLTVGGDKLEAFPGLALCLEVGLVSEA